MRSDRHDPSSLRPVWELAHSAEAGQSGGSDTGFPWVLSLKDVGENSRSLVGGKAANLARLIRGRLPTPPGFCVTTAAFKEFAATCPQGEECSTLLADLSFGRRTDVAVISQKVVGWLAATEVPPTDQRGVLSHGSIVAREYGLPAVTSVGSATRIIHTGDLVRVDGTRGRITVVNRAARVSPSSGL